MEKNPNRLVREFHVSMVTHYQVMVLTLQREQIHFPPPSSSDSCHRLVILIYSSSLTSWFSEDIYLPQVQDKYWLESLMYIKPTSIVN